MLKLFQRPSASPRRSASRVVAGSANDSARAGNRPVRKRSRRWSKVVDGADRLMFSWPVRRKLYQHLAGQVKNGVPVEVALDKHATQLARKKKTSSAKIVRDAGRSMRDGNSLADSLEKWLPLDEAGLISAAEVAGVLPVSLKELVATKRRIKRVSVAFRNAMIRPAIYLMTMYGVVWAIGKYAVPQMAQALPTSRATGSVAVLFGAGDFAMSWLAILPPLVLLAIGFGIRYALPRWRGRYRIAAESYFPFSYYRDAQGFLWLSSFVALLNAGEPDVDVLQRQTRYASPWLKERLVHFRRTMEDGALLPAALLDKPSKKMPAFGFPNPDVVEDIESVHGFPDFNEKIKEVLKEWAEDLEEVTLEKAAVFGFMMEIFMYVLMGSLMYAINQIATQAHY
jgi:type II secretory pathway component PulF